MQRDQVCNAAIRRTRTSLNKQGRTRRHQHRGISIRRQAEQNRQASTASGLGKAAGAGLLRNGPWPGLPAGGCWCVIAAKGAVAAAVTGAEGCQRFGELGDLNHRSKEAETLLGVAGEFR